MAGIFYGPGKLINSADHVMIALSRLGQGAAIYGRRLALPGKGGDAHGYLYSDRYSDRGHLQSGSPDLQKEMTAQPRKLTVNSFDLRFPG